MNITSRVQSLHAGQVAILVTVIAAAAGALLSLRGNATRRQRSAETVLWETQVSLDSLHAQSSICADTTIQLADSLARALNRAMLRGSISSSGGFVKPIAGDCSSIPVRTTEVQSRRTEAAAWRDRWRKQVIGLNVLVLICAGVALSILWGWFEGRRHTGPSSPEEPTAS